MSESITVTPNALRAAAAKQIITLSQAEQLWYFLLQAHAQTGSSGTASQAIQTAPDHSALDEQPTPRFGFGHVMYYFGGLIAIGALTMFTTLGFSQMGFGFLLTVAVGYFVLFVALTEYLQKQRLAIPAGIMGALAVAMIPMGVFALQNLLGFWHSDQYTSQNYRDYHSFIDWRWIVMELATLAGAAGLLYRFRLPFMTMPVAVTGWYMCMDLASMLAGGEYSDYNIRRTCFVVGGLLMVVISLLIDRRTQRRPDFGFWFCLFGALSFWSGVCWSHSDVWWHKHAFAALCVAMIFGGALLQRRVFTILGAMSFAGYLGWLSYAIFENSLLFPIVLSGIGLGIVGFGIWWHKHEREIAQKFSGFMPEWLGLGQR